jgi:uncharacterized membrane protein YgaE (UPF0421/DUF939 family)
MKIKRITLLLCLVCVYNCFLPEGTVMNLMGIAGVGHAAMFYDFIKNDPALTL